jgi:Leucine-rich repeat (LRR) protein
MFYFFQTYGVCKLTKRIIVMNRKTRLPAALLAAAVALIAAVFPLLSAKHGSIAAEPAYSATEQLPRLYESAARRTANRTAPKLSAKKPSANSEFYNEHDLNAALSFLETADSNGVKNGTKLWADYDANDPETWISVGWTEDGRLSIFDADFSSHLAIQGNVADEVGPVGELDLSGCEMLGSVSLVSTCVERLDVSNCPNLFLVSAFYDELKSIDLSGCSSLYFLWVCYNKDLRQIYLSGLSELGALALSGNGLESLDFSSNPHITEIDCSNNSLTALDVSMLSELQSLRCENQDWEMPNSNRISEIDLSHNPMLAEFACYNADVSAVDLSGCTSLQILNADNCPLNELDISDCSMLSVLSICGTNVSEIDLTSSGSMTTIALAGCPMSQATVEQCVYNHPEVTVLDLGRMGLTSFDGSLFNQLDELYLNDNSFTELSISACNINVENLGSIKKLELSSRGEFGSIAMSGTTADTLSLTAYDLCSFRANGCGFDSLPNVVAESENMLVLHIADNAFPGCLDLRAFSGLVDFDCSGNAVTELLLNDDCDINLLDCSNTQLTALRIPSSYVDGSLSIETDGSGFIGAVFNGQRTPYVDDYGNFQESLSAQAVLSAVPAEGFAFDGWYGSGGEKLSESTEFTFSTDSECSLTARFCKAPETTVAPTDTPANPTPTPAPVPATGTVGLSAVGILLLAGGAAAAARAKRD